MTDTGTDAERREDAASSASEAVGREGPPSIAERLFDLRGRRALVTGGSSGIGRAVATALSLSGAHVTVVARSTDRLRETVSQLREQGGQADWLSCDLSDRMSLQRLTESLVTSREELDILVNAAGINIREPMGDLSLEDWDTTLACNLAAPFLLGQAFGPGMAQRGWGRIVHILSQQAFRAFGNSGAYGVSKAGLAGLTRSQAEAWSKDGVCVNAIAPGFVNTPLTQAVFADPARSEAMASRTMVGRNGQVGDFAGVGIFLASEACAYMTGQVLFVDGGFSST